LALETKSTISKLYNIRPCTRRYVKKSLSGQLSSFASERPDPVVIAKPVNPPFKIPNPLYQLFKIKKPENPGFQIDKAFLCKMLNR
jgi:hypothetical protein